MSNNTSRLDRASGSSSTQRNNSQYKNSQQSQHQHQQRSNNDNQDFRSRKNQQQFSFNRESSNHRSQSQNQRNDYKSDKNVSYSSNRDSNNNSDFRSQIGLKFVPGASTRELPPIETKVDPNKKKFTGRCRLFVGNLPHNTSEKKVRELFEKYGEIGEIYLGPKSSFAFIKMDTKQNAENARDSIDSTIYEGRTLRVRLAAHAAAIKIKNLSPQVTNELLTYAFRYFGEIERAVVVTDDKGKSIGEGIVEYAKKASAMFAIKRCQQDNFLLTASPYPVYVEAYDQKDEEDGLPERAILKYSQEFVRERDVGPRFAEQGSFEYTFASKWKALYVAEDTKRQQLEQELRDARKELENQIEYCRIEHDEAQLKNKLRQLEDNKIKLQQFNNPTVYPTDSYYGREDLRRQPGSYFNQPKADNNPDRNQEYIDLTNESGEEMGQQRSSTSVLKEIVPEDTQSDPHNIPVIDTSVGRSIMAPAAATNQFKSFAELAMMPSGDAQPQFIQPPIAQPSQMVPMNMYPVFPPSQQMSMMTGYQQTMASAYASNQQYDSQTYNGNQNAIQRNKFRYFNNNHNNQNNVSNQSQSPSARPKKKCKF